MLKNMTSVLTRRGIGRKLFLIFMLMVLLPSCLIGFLSYTTSKSAISYEIEQSAKKQVHGLNILIDRVVEPIMKDIDILTRSIKPEMYQGLVQNPTLNMASNPEIQSFFKRFKSVHEDDTEVISLVAIDGSFVMEPQRKFAKDYDARKHEWYTKAIENKGSVVISEPYFSLESQNTVVSISKTTDDGKAVMCVNLLLSKYLTSVANEMNIGEEGYTYILDDHNKILAHPSIKAGEELIGDDYQKLNSKHGNIDTKVNGKDATLYFVTNELTGWKAVGVLYDSELSSLTRNTIIITMTMIIVTMVLALIFSLRIQLTLAIPLRSISSKLQRLAKGDLTVDKMIINSKDEIGELSVTYSSLLERLKVLRHEINGSVNTLNRVTDILSTETEAVNQSADIISDSCYSVAESSNTQKDSASEVSTALQANATGISEVANSAIEIGSLSSITNYKAAQGVEAVGNTVNQMSDISSSLSNLMEHIGTLVDRTSNINSLASVISNITSQTNLLSLNASLEAARAGEHGRGFEVVAIEVKKLSEQTQTAAEEILTVISNITKDVEASSTSVLRVKAEVDNGVNLIHDVKDLFTDIVNNMNLLNDEIQQLSSVSEELAASSEEISASVESLTGISYATSQEANSMMLAAETQKGSVSKLGETVTSVVKTANNLKENINQFKLSSEE
ncbi:methyl-accepting chemotaxis protein [Paenibacillus guangzhouensis]|uniref:methyl-accepting chemotaxis protein n=1 Tax=Paenibacillus guangzhouensis TaxID=1473112 RepID=UPI001266BD3F|nr:methyl-accepting chemotaxis protein [Paenibacillus guangzhouensis]